MAPCYLRPKTVEVEDLRSIIEHLPRCSSSDGGPAERLTLTALRDRALLLVGWTEALRRSELVALTTSDVEFVEGEGVNIFIRRSKSDQEAEGLVKGLLYRSNNPTKRPVRSRPSGSGFKQLRKKLKAHSRGTSSAASTAGSRSGSRQ
jgi:integrase